MSISLGIVEEVHTSIIRPRHALDGDLFADLATIRDPGAERQLAQLETRAAEPTIIRLWDTPLRQRNMGQLISTSKKDARQTENASDREIGESRERD